MSFSLTRFLLGRPLANREASQQKLGVFSGVPAMGLDGLGSASYGPEAALTVLAGTGVAGLAFIGPITWVILLLLAILWFSYWQTIVAYPNNGGSYIVARENLGTGAGLLAAAALMVDYLLNVAVGISAGVGALTSAIPSLHQVTLWLCLAILALVTVVNLRGTKESRAWLGRFPPTRSSAAWPGSCSGARSRPRQPAGIPRRSFPLQPVRSRGRGRGLAAAPGVRQRLRRDDGRGGGQQRRRRVPRPEGAQRPWNAVGHRDRVGAAATGHRTPCPMLRHLAMDQTKAGYQSVISQLVAAVYGRGPLYYVVVASVLAVLCLSANTSFVGFPRLCRLVAEDGYLPRAFALPGRRLVYTEGYCSWRSAPARC